MPLRLPDRVRQVGLLAAHQPLVSQEGRVPIVQQRSGRPRHAEQPQAAIEPVQLGDAGLRLVGEHEVVPREPAEQS